MLDFPRLKGLYLVDPYFEEEEDGDSPPIEDWELTGMGMTLAEYSEYTHCIRGNRCRSAL